MIRKTEYMTFFLSGGVIYNLLELLWRGYSHWSMTIAGGLCCIIIHFINQKWIKKNIFFRCLIGCAVITAVEFAIGIIVNRILMLNVWDYSNMSFNVLGQICPVFSLLWFVLSFPICYFSNVIRYFFDSIETREKQTI